MYQLNTQSPKPKALFSWGTGIAIVYGFFAVGMIVMVFFAQRHDPGLVSKNYYELDLHYQERMEEKQNTAALQKPLKVTFVQEKNVLSFHFPDETGQPSGGSIHMFRGASAAEDFWVPVKTDTIGDMQIPVGHLPKSRWNIEVIWNAGSRSFFHETSISL